MNCQSVSRLLSACQDGELDPARRRELESHLKGCRACRAEWDGLQELVRRLRLSPPPALDPFFPTRVMAGLGSKPIKRFHPLPAAAYALIFVTIFLTGFLLQNAANTQAQAEPLPAATFSAVLLEPQGLGLLAVQDDTLKLFPGSDHGQK